MARNQGPTWPCSLHPLSMVLPFTHFCLQLLPNHHTHAALPRTLYESFKPVWQCKQSAKGLLCAWTRARDNNILVWYPFHLSPVSWRASMADPRSLTSPQKHPQDRSWGVRLESVAKGLQRTHTHTHTPPRIGARQEKLPQNPAIKTCPEPSA